MWLPSGFDLPLCDAPWLIWSVVWACLGIRDHDEEMVLGGVGGRWMLHEVTLFSLWLSITHCHLLSESNHLQHKVRMLWKKKVQLPGEHIALEECSKESKRLCKEGSLKIHDICTKQKQVEWMKNQGQVALVSNHKHSQAYVTILYLIQALSSVSSSCSFL